MNHFNIIRSAPSMQFQDLGRFGYSHLGLSQGGAIDLHAHCWANHLLGNHPNCTTIEISYGNAIFQALEDSTIALTGAEMHASIDGADVSNWCSHKIRKGQSLKLNYATKGLHSYLAIQHGFTAPSTLGSSSTVIRNSIGNLLQQGMTLEAPPSGKIETRYASRKSLPDYQSIREIRIILPDHQDREISSEILNTRYTISADSDRMGINLNAQTPLPPLSGILSEGIALGTVQLPPSGNPIVLMNDRQTQGGYAKVGAVARIDLPLLAQARPGTQIKLIPVSQQQASNQWTDFAQFFGL